MRTRDVKCVHCLYYTHVFVQINAWPNPACNRKTICCMRHWRCIWRKRISTSLWKGYARSTPSNGLGTHPYFYPECLCAFCGPSR